MGDNVRFMPGTIWWLPRQHDICTSESLESYVTVPPKCFGHPVLVVGWDETTQNVAIVIVSTSGLSVLIKELTTTQLTSFGGAKKIPHKIRNRGHTPQDYVPIHPAWSLYNNTPTLRLGASKEFNRLIWVNVQPYRCPGIWLQNTWPCIWKRNDVGRHIESSSLCELAHYAIRKRYDPVVYEKLLEMNAHPTITPLSLQNPEPLRIDTLVDTSVYVPVSSAEGSVEMHNPPTPPTTQPPEAIIPVWHIPSETDPLLPRTNPRVFTTDPSGRIPVNRRPAYRVTKSNATAKYLLCLLKVVGVLLLLIGVPWACYRIAFWLLAVCKNLGISLANTLYGALKGVTRQASHSNSGMCREVSELIVKLVKWVNTFEKRT